MHRIRVMTAAAVVILGLCLLANPVHAIVFDFSAAIDGLQTVPPSGSTGTGTGIVSYDDATNLLSWDVSWSGLTGPVTVMHFHGPAPPGANAGVQVNIGAISGTTSPSIGSATITNAQAADLINELYYINIHTAQFPGGEIRGQVLLVPEPAGVALASLGISAGAFFLRRRRLLARC